MKLLGLPVRLAVFDMAGTIINEGGIIYKAINETLDNMGYHSREKERNSWPGRDKKEVMYTHIQKFHDSNTNIGGIVNTAEKNLLTILEREYFTNENIKLMDNTLELFDYMRRNNVKVALNTGYPSSLQKIINHFDLKDNIDAYISSEEVFRGRPYPYMIMELMKKTYIYDPKRVIKIGDTKNDIMEGINANCGLSIGVLSGAEEKDVLNKKANMVLNNIGELEKFLR